MGIEVDGKFGIHRHGGGCRPIPTQTPGAGPDVDVVDDQGGPCGFKLKEGGLQGGDRSLEPRAYPDPGEFCLFLGGQDLDADQFGLARHGGLLDLALEDGGAKLGAGGDQNALFQNAVAANRGDLGTQRRRAGEDAAVACDQVA